MLYYKSRIFMKSDSGVSGASRQKGGGGAIAAGTWNPQPRGGGKTTVFTSEGGRIYEGEKAKEIINLIMRSPVGTVITETYKHKGVEETSEGRITVNSRGYKILLYKGTDGRQEIYTINPTNIVSNLLFLNEKVSIRQTPLTQAEKAAPKVAEPKVKPLRTAKPKENVPNIPTEVKVTERRRWQNPEWEGRGDKENPRYMTSETTHKLQVYPRVPEGTVRIGWYRDKYTDYETGKTYYMASATAPAPTKPFEVTHGKILGYVSEKTAREWERNYYREHGEHSIEYQFLRAPYGLSEGGAH